MVEEPRPPPHSPMAALLKAFAFWIGLPVAALVAAIAFMNAYQARKTGGPLLDAVTKEMDAGLHERRQRDAESLARARAHPDAGRLEAELSKMTPEQRKARVNELMDAVAKKARSREPQ